jgi:hypothetical protein
VKRFLKEEKAPLTKRDQDGQQQAVLTTKHGKNSSNSA